MCFRLLPDSSLCQNGKQVEIITKMIFELCYIEVEACVQVRAEGSMEHEAQGKQSDALGITCWSSHALKEQKHYNVL